MKYRNAILMLVTLLLAGCKFEAATEVRGNGSGELRSQVGFTPEERQNLEKQNTASAQDFCNTSGQTPRGVTVTEEKRGDETWCVTTTKFGSLEALADLYREKKGILVDQLEIAGGQFYYDLQIDTSSSDSSFSNFSTITWVISLPGAALESNATQSDGKTLTWTIAPKSGIAQLHARSQVEQTGLAPSALVGILAGSLAGAGLALLFLRRRSPK